jgi:hypothetical protein
MEGTRLRVMSAAGMSQSDLVESFMRTDSFQDGECFASIASPMASSAKVLNGVPELTGRFRPFPS